MSIKIADSKQKHAWGDAFWTQMRERLGPRIVVAFSSGKDALAMTILLKPYFEEMVPFFGYLVPGFRIMEEALDYYEDKLFGRPIIRVPHPSFFEWMTAYAFQTPEGAQEIARAGLPSSISLTKVAREIARLHGIDPKLPYAFGRRAGRSNAKSNTHEPRMSAWPTGEKLYRQVREICGPRIILGFSRGKDAIAAALPLMRFFDEVIPVYYDPLPGLEFTAESIDYFERKLFKRKVHVVPHPNFFRMLENSVFQSWESFHTLAQIPFPKWKDEDVRQYVIELEGLPANTYLATGVRAADSVTRHTALAKHGPITASRHKFHAIWDWKKAQLVDEITRSGVKLPIDYSIWGRTLDGIDARFMLPMRRHLPDDYRRACGFFPIIPADIVRYERIRREQGEEIE